MDERLRGVLFGIASALLFGASAPLSKLLLPGTGPLLLAGLLYLGGGAAFFLVRRQPSETPMQKQDLVVMTGAVLSGAALAPPLMLWGLTRVSGLTGSLLLNLEAPFTMALAVAVFGEHLSRRELLAAVLTVAGGAIVGLHGERGLTASALGSMAIALACLCWAIDNNLSARLALRDPVQVVRVKMLAAGALNLIAGLLFGQRSANPAPALLLGAFSYGLSYLCYLLAQRRLGAARQGALFAVAPFAGALLAIGVLHDVPGWFEMGGALVMALGVTLLLRARHGHLHTHEETTHEHLHVHDAHHQHSHDAPVTEPHSHVHHHAALTHDHPHVSDVHHRHRH